MNEGMRFKYLIARMAHEDPARFLSTFGGEGGRAYLADLFAAMHPSAPPDAVSDVAVEHHGEVLVLRLPAPWEPNAPFAIGVAGSASGLRVFVLERSAHAAVPAFVAEIAPQARANFGPSDSSCAAFVARIAEILSTSASDPS
jgi:hypothetical protein